MKGEEDVEAVVLAVVDVGVVEVLGGPVQVVGADLEGPPAEAVAEGEDEVLVAGRRGRQVVVVRVVQVDAADQRVPARELDTQLDPAAVID